jgi:hypothetical protein
MFGVTFAVDQPLPYDLSVVGDARTGVPPPTFSFSGPFGGGPLQGTEQNLSGVLAPGTYYFTTDAASPNSGFFVNFRIGTAVPLPPAAWSILLSVPILWSCTRSLRPTRERRDHGR